MNIRKSLSTLLAGVMLACTVGCASLTSSTSLTPNEQMASATVTARAAVQSADQLLATGKINPDEAAQLKSQADQLVAMVKTIRALPVGSTTQGSDLAQLATLTAALSTYVTSLQTGVPK